VQDKVHEHLREPDHAGTPAEGNEKGARAFAPPESRRSLFVPIKHAGVIPDSRCQSKGRAGDAGGFSPLP